MYIEKTTAAERETICEAMSATFYDVRMARRMLMDVIADHFEDEQPGAISAPDAERLRDLLCCINNQLWTAELEYSLTTGEYTAGGCKSYFEGVKRVMQVKEVEELRRKVDYKTAEKYADMEDEDALPILRNLVRKSGCA